MNILVSGANGNLGTAVVDTLLNSGKQIFGLYANEDQLRKDKRPIQKESIDLTKPDKAKDVVEKMYSKMGAIQGAVLTVGGFAMGKLQETSSDEIHSQIKLNFDTAYHLVQPLLTKMKKGGQIFLIGAKPVLNIDELKGKLAYGLSKQLIFTLAEVINADSKNHGINCSVIVPSIIDTPSNRKSMPDMDFSAWVKPEEIAKTINFYLDNPYLKQAIIKAYGNVE
ncbi:SDR family NAD(P)-dependent oxidoreductase [Marivirga sp. S37H4]|uniref:SDR family NAD(P)-dependent oxidoreductase n=1 Tax=Marivirga aurantiaca TaxID=2802615 RepID=A0A934WZH8_9BACT|nr:SDR family NAD(P)-dependent oxidoreductase [Marivirga aurantiaca]MBK6265761.1 SDR family NAD(P)-dependent oxidoreductase [Marivirga aurantiaca]